MSRLETRNLTVNISCLCVVESLDLVLEPGQFWMLLGPNGIGKTTLLHTLSGLRRAEQGEILVGSQPLDAWPRRRLAQQLGLLQQHTAYHFDATVLEIALMGRHPYLSPWQNEDETAHGLAMEALEQVGLHRQTTQPVTQLSGGEARRLAVATLLVQDPDILLLDEPSNHLDPAYQRHTLSALGEPVRRGDKCLIAATHDLNLAMRYGSHALLLEGNGQWSSGPTSELMTRARLEQLYGVDMTELRTDEGQKVFGFL